jgi:hypothetical protein
MTRSEAKDAGLGDDRWAMSASRPGRPEPASALEFRPMESEIVPEV